MKLPDLVLLERSCLERLIEKRAPEYKADAMRIFHQHGLEATLKYIAQIEADARDRIDSLLHHAKKII